MRSAFGVEFDQVKCDKAKAFGAQTLAELAKRGRVDAEVLPPPVLCAAVEEVGCAGQGWNWLDCLEVGIRVLP